MHGLAPIQHVLQLRAEGSVREVIDKEDATEQPTDVDASVIDRCPRAAEPKRVRASTAVHSPERIDAAILTNPSQNFFDESKSDVAVCHGTKLLWHVLTARNVKVL
jgi:hypothetical protein